MTLREYKEKRLYDPEFSQAYFATKPEMNVIRAMIDARISQNISQKELAEKTGIAQTEISKLESGKRNPSIRLLQRIADGMGMVLNVDFVPKDELVRSLMSDLDKAEKRAENEGWIDAKDLEKELEL